MKPPSKTTTSSIEKRSVSATPGLFAAADQRADEKRMSNFSEYVRDLMRRDVSGELSSPPAQPVKEAA